MLDLDLALESELGEDDLARLLGSREVRSEGNVELGLSVGDERLGSREGLVSSEVGELGVVPSGEEVPGKEGWRRRAGRVQPSSCRVQSANTADSLEVPLGLSVPDENESHCDGEVVGKG